MRISDGSSDVCSSDLDIGSNSIRLVVWQDGGRVPPVMFNEKLMAGLGRGLRETGRLEEDAMAAGERALARFAGLARSIGVSRLRAVATAAVRQDSNGPDFVARESGRASGRERMWQYL